MLIENGMLKTNDGDLENVVISDGVSNLEELIYEGSVWLLARRNIKALLSIKNADGTSVTIKRIICNDCTIDFEKKPFWLEELTYASTGEALNGYFGDSWIMDYVRIIHCTDCDAYSE